MSFIGIITNAKNEPYISKMLEPSFKKEEVIFITDKNVGNMKNIRFETIVMDTKLNNSDALKSILYNAKYVILNSDVEIKPQIFEDLNLIVISYGFQGKATFTVSSVEENDIIICLQRIMKTVCGSNCEPQELIVRRRENLDTHAIIWLQILLLFYEKISISTK